MLYLHGSKQVSVDINKLQQANAEVIWSLFLDPKDIHVNTNYTFAKQKGVCGALVNKLSLEERLKETMLEIWSKEEAERNKEIGEMQLKWEKYTQNILYIYIYVCSGIGW